jgi:hypothetical protein
MSCATHRLDGGIAMEVTIQDSEGNILETMKR